jgi:hypothetical protein
MFTANQLSRFTLAAGLVLVAVLALVYPAAVQAQCACQLPDNGNGTVDLMPQCSVGYLGHMQIVTGLPAGATIEIDAILKDFVNQPEVPGGSLGGHVQTFSADLQMTMSGTGALAGFNRLIHLPVTGEAHSAPRTFGDAVQDFDHDMFRLDGQLFGDPDFCTLELRAGVFYGYPSPGHTLLTRIGPAGDPFNVDSFFDVAYELEFQGCPGSILDGMQGITVRQDEFNICGGPVPTQSVSWGLLKGIY